MRTILLAGLGGLALATAACTGEQAPPAEAAAPAAEEQAVQPASAGPPAVTGEIDWATARADAAKRPADVVIPQAAGSDPLTVPMLLPGGIVQTASDRPVPPRIMVVTPGIRPVENRVSDDQKRTVDVAQAFRNGADYIVMGRPIRGAADPKAAAEAVQASIASVFPE